MVNSPFFDEALGGGEERHTQNLCRIYSEAIMSSADARHRPWLQR